MRLQIVLLTSGEELVGIAPFYLQDTGFLRGNILRFIGTGEAEQDEVLSEYLDLIALPEYENTVVRAVSNWIAANRQWRQLRFDDVLGSALCMRLTCRMLGCAALATRISGERYSICLPESLELYLQQLSTSRRNRYKRCCTAIRKDGGDPSTAPIAGLHDIEDRLQVLKKLNSERWKAREGRGVFESDRFLRFHLELCTLLWPLGQADIKVLLVKGKPVAALYLFYSGNDCHYYQSGFSVEGANRYMPLFVSHLSEIEHSIALKLTRYDFMRGAVDSYKKDYACEADPMYVVRGWRNGTERMFSECKRCGRRTVKLFSDWLASHRRM